MLLQDLTLELPFGGMNLNIRDKHDFSFDEVLKVPKRSIDLTSYGLVLNFAIAKEYLFKSYKNKDYEGGLLVGLRIGYLLSAFDEDWFYGWKEVSGGAEPGFTGPYIRVVIGGWANQSFLNMWRGCK